MSLVTAAPELISVAATDLAGIGSTVNAAHLAAATPTTAVIPAAADEVSSSIAHLFSQHAQDYQALAGQAAAFHEKFVQQLTSSAGSYSHAEAANAASLNPLGSIAAAASQAATSLPDILQNVLTLAIAAVVVPVLGVLLLPVISIAAVAVGLALGVFAFGAALAFIGSYF